MIGIIVAMDKEMRLLVESIEDASELEVGGVKYVRGRMCGHDVVATKCGIGKVNAAIGAYKLIEAFHPTLVVNTGVAGGTGGRAGILDVVLASQIAYHDVWCGPGTEWGDAAGCPRFFTPPFDAATMAAAIGAKPGLVASGDIFVSRVEDVERILALYPEAVAVDMESAAIAQTCYKQGVAMACVRVISDTPGGSDNISQYESFWEDAPRNTFEALKRLLEKL